MNKTIFLAFISVTLFSCGGGTTDKTDLTNKDSLNAPSNGFLYAFEDSNGTGFKDSKGAIVIPAKYSQSFTDTFKKAIAFVVDPKEGPIAIDRTGKMLLKPYIFDNGPDYIEEGLFRYTENEKIGFADENGKIVIPARYDFASFFKNGLAAFGKDFKIVMEDEMQLIKEGKWGFINMKGDTVVPQKYNELPSIHDGSWAVKKGHEVILIDKDGKEGKPLE
jgi:hypothetical protein